LRLDDKIFLSTRLQGERGYLLVGLLILLSLARVPAEGASPLAVEARHGMVVSAQHYASEVGAGILAEGGNAIDAAVAVGYALAVVDPCCGNIGGGGFMTIHLKNGRDTFINFRETAPAAATAAMYLDPAGQPVDDLSRSGYLAAGVPGTVMGLEHAAKEYGRLTRRALLMPAITMARDGYVLSRADAEILDGKRFSKDPVAARIFLRSDGSRFEAGDRHVQTELAATLEQIAEHGLDGFYQGPIPAAVEKASSANGGILTVRDFADYRVTEGPPLTCSYRGYHFVSAPPPSSGGTAICEILNILEGYDLKALGFRSAHSVHLLVEAMRHAYRDRNTRLGDPAFVQNPLERLLSKDYAAAIRAAIDAGSHPNPPPLAGEGRGEKAETTHYSVVDGEGNAVAVTYTINGSFGAGIMAPGTGFFLNNEMDDFAVKPGTPNLYGLVQGEANAIAPGKRPLSSMAPTLVEKDGRLFLVLGSPGGSRIITAVLETILDIVDYGMMPGEAVEAPRLHHQGLPDEIAYERSGLAPEVIAQLAGMGYKLVEQRLWGAVELIEVANGRLYGASDPRRPAGAAIGY